MNDKRNHIVQLIEQGDFKEARRFIRTLKNVNRVELLRRVDIAEEKHLQRTASRRENIEIIEALLDKGHFEKARRFVQHLNHPKKTELLLKIEDKRQTDTMKAIVVGRKIETEPTHPHDLLESRPLGMLGMPFSFLMGLRMVEILRNFKRLDRTRSMWMWTIVYASFVTLFALAGIKFAVQGVVHASSMIELGILFVGLLLLMVSPYLALFIQTRAYDSWYHDFKMS